MPRKCSASASMPPSLTPRLTTAFTFTGPRPASTAASMPSSTLATGKSTSFMALNIASSSESSDTVTRVSPASASDWARWRSSEPLVVIVRSSMPSIAASVAISWSALRRSSGSPPVSRIFVTPSPANTRASRSISSNDSTSWRFRNWKPGPKISFGMQ